METTDIPSFRLVKVDHAGAKTVLDRSAVKDALWRKAAQVERKPFDPLRDRDQSEKTIRSLRSLGYDVELDD